MDILTDIEPWHWLIVSLLLFGLEALGAGGFLLGGAFAGVLLAVVLWLVPDMGWASQFMIFGAASLILTLTYWKLFRRVNEQSDRPELNNRTAMLVGSIVELSEDFPEGLGRIKIGDTLWKSRSPVMIPSGKKIKVVGYMGTTLEIEPVE
ncbi:hypothetical protein ACH42_04340 [Endozoicomonas sp. (ex Bugula neritina AB1)]|nr:hypothetical protein ACH42_04340 [Endozoicomonas sp. (ex Bugula neritina AB1)]